MTTTRPRRIVRRAVIGLLFTLACLLAYLEWHGFHEIDPWVVGRWVYVYDDRRTNVVYEYNSDGTGAAFVQPGPPEYEFVWSVNDSHLTTELDESGLAYWESLLNDARSMLTSEEPDRRGFTTKLIKLYGIAYDVRGGK